jgi:hypothetical protein
MWARESAIQLSRRLRWSYGGRRIVPAADEFDDMPDMLRVESCRGWFRSVPRLACIYASGVTCQSCLTEGPKLCVVVHVATQRPILLRQAASGNSDEVSLAS